MVRIRYLLATALLASIVPTFASGGSDESLSPNRPLMSLPPNSYHAAVEPEKRGNERAYALNAGFSTVDFTWRAGAKPGQVGTAPSLAETARLWLGLADLIVHGFRHQTRDRPIALLEYATDWTVQHLTERLGQIHYDRYTDVFQPGRGMHTRSTVKAIVLESGGEKVAIVRADLYLMQKHIWRRVAELVGPSTGLAPEQILIAASHNHSAADAAFTAAGISTLAENFDPRHFVWVTHKIADAIIEADMARVPARMGAIRTQMREVQRNVIGPATGMATPPDAAEPVEVQAGYPRDFFDDDLWVVYFDEVVTERRLGAYVVFGMHPESLEDGHGLLSSDFFGPMEQGLESRWGCPVIWSPGALGDVEPDNGDNTGTDYWREDFARLDEQVAVLVDAISPVLESPLSTDQVIPASENVVVRSRMRILPGAENTSYPCPTPWMLPVTEYLSPEWPLTCVRALTESANIMLQTVQLGDVLLLGAPSEITSDLAKHIRSRVDAIENNLYQGYVWPNADAWVEDEINRNFDPRELPGGTGFPMPIVLSQVNDWMGYIVTRWEFVNRSHYRQSLTLYGEDTANYVAAGLEGLVKEIRTGDSEDIAWDEPSLLDLELGDEVYDVVDDLDEWVSEWARTIPENNPITMGTGTDGPVYVPDDEMGAPSIHFSWRGATSDMEIPAVVVERALDYGVWEKAMDETHPHLWVLYEEGGRWEAVWHLVDDPGAGTFRFKVRGMYRGHVAGSSTPDPIWDPEGKNELYQALSLSIALPE